jgi:hypothetical protein
MALAALIVSVVAVLVSLTGAYFAWRQARATETQAKTAQDTLTRQIADAHLANAPRFVTEIVSNAVDRHMRLVPTALSIENGSVIEFNEVEVALSAPIPGLSGFRIGTQVAMVTILEVLRPGESRHIPLAVEEPGPEFLRGDLRVRAEALNGDTWNTTLTVYWNSCRVPTTPRWDALGSNEISMTWSLSGRSPLSASIRILIYLFLLTVLSGAFFAAIRSWFS